jgi:hypothetical protein
MAEALETRKLRVRFPLVSLEFFIDVMTLGTTKPLKP